MRAARRLPAQRQRVEHASGVEASSVVARDAAAVINTGLMMLAAAGARIFSEHEGTRAGLGAEVGPGRQCNDDDGNLLTSCRHGNGDSLPGARDAPEPKRPTSRSRWRPDLLTLMR